LKGAKWVNQHIIKPILPVVSAGLDKVKPGLGTAVGFASNLIGGDNSAREQLSGLARERLGRMRPVVMGNTE
jgi:hypothetical protein